MSVVPGNAMQQRLARLRQQAKSSRTLGSGVVEVEIIKAYDGDTFDSEGVPGEIAHLVQREIGTMFAKVRSIRTKREFFVPFRASEAEILKTHGNAVLLKGMRGTIVFNGTRPEESRLDLLGEPMQPLRNSSGTNVFDVVSFI